MVFGNREPAVLQHVSQRARLPICQTVTARKSLLPDCPLSPLLDSGELGRKAFGEELDPAGPICARLTAWSAR